MPERRTHVDGGELAGLLTLAGSSESFKACLAAYTDQPPWGELMKRMAGWKAVIRGAPTDTSLMVHIVLQPYPSEDSDGGHSAEFKRSVLGVRQSAVSGHPRHSPDCWQAIVIPRAPVLPSPARGAAFHGRSPRGYVLE